jgi:hypothetical protein
MNRPIILSTILAVCSSAYATNDDALAMLMLSNASQADEAAAVPAKTAKPSPLYIKADVGLNLLQDADWRDTGFASKPRFQFNAGIDSSLGLGVKIQESTKGGITERFNMEFSVGFMWNSLDAVSSSVEQLVDPIGPNSSGFWGLSGGEGRMMQIPITVDFIWTMYETDRISISLNGGFGAQWTDFDLKNANFSEYTAPTGTVTRNFDLNASGNAVAFRYQGGLDVRFKLAAGIELGGYLQYAGATSSSLGRLTTGSPAPLGELKLGALNNFSVGARLTIAF